MSKSHSVSDLRNELQSVIKPLKDNIESLTQSQNIATAQVSEMYQMITALSIKLDALDQRADVAIEKPVKKATKKNTKLDEPEEVKERAAPKKFNDADSDIETDSDQVSIAASDKPKLPVKPSKPTKTTKPEEITKMNKKDFFKMKYAEDETYFDQFLTAAVRKDLENKNRDEWEKLSGDKLKNAKRDAYYKFVSENFESDLQAIKADYNDKKNKVTLTRVDTEQTD